MYNLLEAQFFDVYNSVGWGAVVLCSVVGSVTVVFGGGGLW